MIRVPLALRLAGSLLASLASLPAQGNAIEDAQCGMAVPLPAADWKRSDHSGQGVVVHIYSPASPPIPRVTLMRFPAVYLPDGMKTRGQQIKAAPGVKSEPLGKSELLGQEATRLVYDARTVRTVEVGTLVGDAFLIVQVAAREADWKDEEKAGRYRAVFTEARLLDKAPVAPPLDVDTRTPAEVRAARTPDAPTGQTASIVEHDIALALYPADGRLTVTDDFVVEGEADSTRELELVCTRVDIDAITAGGTALKWRREGESQLIVELARPLARGERRRLRFAAHKDDFRLAQEQKLVREISVFGQVDATSCFSSHVFYYPIDRRNDAAMSMAISVPAGWTAVTGGEPEAVERRGARRVFRYTTAFRTPRKLPFGFAAGRYERISGKTPGGLNLDLYYPEGKEKEAGQRLAVAVESGSLFEEAMGPLPWKRVAFCHVVPSEKETGVSLPGLVLFSDGFFADAEGVQLRGASLNDPAGMGLLIIADELSHQWNFYSVSLPNELAEGISTFTNLLWVARHTGDRGEKEYRDGIAFCANAYLATARATKDVAVADPALYRSDIYRVAAFCKVPAVLDLLRSRLGDERFFAAWRKAFAALRDGKGGYDGFERELGKATGTDLRPFFDQWFFQAGHPRLQVTWDHSPSSKLGSGHRLRLKIVQSQPGGLFDIGLRVRVDCGDAGETLLEDVRVSQREQLVSRAVPGAVRAVEIEPEGDSPLIRVVVEQGDVAGK